MSISRQRAIFEQCHQCVAADKKHSWVKDVEECKGYSCCLYHLRPVSTGNHRKIEAFNKPEMIKDWHPDIADHIAPSLSRFLSCDQALESAISTDEGNCYE